MTWLDDVALHHLLVSKVFIGKLLMCCSCVLCPLVHLMPPCAPHTTPPEKRLGNDGPLVKLKPLKMIVSFTTRTMVKMTPTIGVVFKRYQFSRFYVK
jgi:hypothetical protein